MNSSLPVAKAREIVFQILFSFEMTGITSVEEILSLFTDELKVSRSNLDRPMQQAQDVWNHHAEIDQLISSMTTGYDFSRIGKVEKSVLRLSLFELLFEKILPLEIIISEAVRLTKKFSSKEGSHFVHAIIDAISKSKFTVSP